MCNCHSILERCVMFSGVKLSIRSFNLFLKDLKLISYFHDTYIYIYIYIRKIKQHVKQLIS